MSALAKSFSAILLAIPLKGTAMRKLLLPVALVAIAIPAMAQQPSPPALAQRINLTAILVRYSPVLPHRQPLAMSRGYPFVASLNYALDS